MSRFALPATLPPLNNIAVAALKGAILLGAAATGAAHAQQSPALDRMSISVGGFYARPEIQLGADTPYGRVATPDERIGEVTLPRVKADLLIGDHQGVSFDYARFDKAYRSALSGGTVHEGSPVNGTIQAQADLRLDMARLSYKWWFGREKNAFGIGLGAAYLGAKLSGSAEASVDAPAQLGNLAWSGSASAKDSVWAPTVELAFRHALNENVRLYAEAAGVKKNGGTVEGHMYSGAVGVEWFPTTNVGLVLDYGVREIDLHRNGDRTGDLGLRLSGPSAFVKVRF